MIKPLGKVVAAKISVQQTTAQKSLAGLYIPNKEKHPNPLLAEIIAIGDEITKVKVGEKVVFIPYSPYDVKDGPEDLVMIEEQDILGVVTE